MAQSAPIIPVNAKMYRHFAIATVLITGCLAMFASGENREALADTIKSQQQQSQMQQAQQQTDVKKSNFTDKRKVKGQFGSDGDLRWRPPTSAKNNAGFAQTTQAELVAASGVTFTSETQGPSGGQTLTGPLPPGMSPAEYAQSKNKKKKKKPVQASREMTEQEVEAMLAASDARSLTRQD